MNTHPQPVGPGNQWSLVVVEDDPTTSNLICEVFARQGIHTVPCSTYRDADSTLRQHSRVAAMLIDIGLPDGNGIDLVRSVRQTHPNLPCFILTATNTVDTAVLAMKTGAMDYFTKPFDPDTLVTSVKGSMAVYSGSANEIDSRSNSLKARRHWKSPAMLRAFDAATKAARNTAPVILTGPHNTGKGMIARWIHDSGSRRTGPFITINPAIMTASQTTTELFGAVTGAGNSTGHGRLARTHGGTLYLENVDLLEPSAQAALLAWLNSSHPDKTSRARTCRLITSSAANLQEAVSLGRFRQDLWYALSVYHVEVPSLADRPEDLPLLCENIITNICVAGRLRRPSLTRKALEMLLDHTWPGNLSELHNVLEHALTHSNDGLIGPDDLPRLANQGRTLPAEAIPVGNSSIDEITKASLMAALESCQGNRRRTAQRLKVSLRTVYNMIQRYELAEHKTPTSKKS